jgi:hypothetical protein
MRVAQSEIAKVFSGALDKVWDFLSFAGEGDVICTFTPAGRAATTLHVGPYVFYLLR